MVFEAHSDPRDVEMETLIHERIQGMGGRHLRVQVKDGVVTLSGSTGDYEDKRQIETAVKMIGNVHQVINQIMVVSIEDPFDNYR
jgi:osmotically-inducible protein OsmY